MAKFQITKSGRCKGCGTQERPHKAHGLCTRCYYRTYKRKAKRRSLSARANGIEPRVDNP